mmetsp:Transcript_39217/g.121209  ORF Transcript_39217/g.121209 Transcript_39217/m.121209 type:complete len:201 (+) Transcript_39217:628-1230(+)
MSTSSKLWLIAAPLAPPGVAAPLRSMLVPISRLIGDAGSSRSGAGTSATGPRTTVTGAPASVFPGLRAVLTLAEGAGACPPFSGAMGGRPRRDSGEDVLTCRMTFPPALPSPSTITGFRARCVGLPYSSAPPSETGPGCTAGAVACSCGVAVGPAGCVGACCDDGCCKACCLAASLDCRAAGGTSCLRLIVVRSSCRSRR